MSKRKLFAACAVCSVLIAVAPLAPAQQLAPGVQPGAQRNEPTAPRSAPSAPSIDIPAVIERPLDADEGPRIPVNRFDIQGLDAVDEERVARSEVEAIANGAIADHNGQFTIGQLQAVADAISNLYRSRGYLYATAIVPVQEVADGSVVIELLIGRLGRVTVEGNEHYTAARIARPFDDLVGQPIEQNELEAALLRVNTYPGLAVTGVMRPGQEVGEGELVARVQQERRFDLSVGGDSFGRRETGVGRIHGLAEFYNPFGIGDKFTAYFQPSIWPHQPIGGQKYMFGEYQAPLLWPGHNVAVFYRYNDFRVDRDYTPNRVEVDGVTGEGGIELRHDWILGRTWTLRSFEGFTRKQADTYINNVKQFSDILAVVHFRVEGDMVDRRFFGVNGFGIEYRRGIPGIAGAMTGTSTAPHRPNPSRASGSKPNSFATGEFDTLQANVYRLQSLSQFGEFFQDHQILVRFEGQWSNDLLVPFEQFAVGGIQSVRGYEPSHALFDRGVFGSIEYQMPPPFIADTASPFGQTWGELLQVSAFYDYAWGKLNDAVTAGDAYESRGFHSAGMAVQFRHGEDFYSKLTIASAMRERVRSNPRVWLEFNYQF
ncbi:MAG: ShlB/FhaC/HecB family hemolysin secretion/activation protein [Gammaproteobacteria bacterium]|nr:ShlB/FhaC/HecB family hemolysin secretion/activation protein [Gammaproteobacteria bacterium]MCP5201257.1 ShlB/FhaC/HecB family hemolysin secretion/activation protein [Gammaproteobacteria bacterium]